MVEGRGRQMIPEVRQPLESGTRAFSKLLSFVLYKLSLNHHPRDGPCILAPSSSLSRLQVSDRW